jgi:hypothetical protein
MQQGEIVSVVVDQGRAVGRYLGQGKPRVALPIDFGPRYVDHGYGYGYVRRSML